MSHRARPAWLRSPSPAHQPGPRATPPQSQGARAPRAVRYLLVRLALAGRRVKSSGRRGDGVIGAPAFQGSSSPAPASSPNVQAGRRPRAGRRCTTTVLAVCGPVGLGDLPGGAPSPSFPRALFSGHHTSSPRASLTVLSNSLAVCHIHSLESHILHDSSKPLVHTRQVDRLQGLVEPAQICCRAIVFLLRCETNTMEQPDPPVDIHAPFTRAERMQQLADIDRVSNKLPGRLITGRPATC